MRAGKKRRQVGGGEQDVGAETAHVKAPGVGDGPLVAGRGRGMAAMLARRGQGSCR
jgi:hypothetical protein